MAVLKNINSLSIDDLDLALTERQLQNESILWMHDTANEDYNELTRQFNLKMNLIPLHQVSGTVNLTGYTIILMDCFYQSDLCLLVYEKLKATNSDAVFICIVDKNSPSSMLVELFSRGITSYLLHPINTQNFWIELMNGLQKKREKVIKKQMEEIHSTKLKERLEWLTYKEQMRDMGKNSEGNLMIESLRNSLTQAGGFGIIMSLIDMAKGFSERHGEDYIVKKNIMEMLIANNDYAQKFLDALNGVVGLMSQNLMMARVSTDDLIHSLKDSMEGVRNYLLRRNISLQMPVLSPHGEIKYMSLNMEAIITVIEELVINAGKYGREHSVIEVFGSYVKGYFCISVKNELKDEKGGIPDALIEQLMKPFFRYHPPVEDIVEVEKYGLGLGLTAVSYIMNKHHGMFIFSNVKDHSGDNVVPCTLTQIYIPIQIRS